MYSLSTALQALAIALASIACRGVARHPYKPESPYHGTLDTNAQSTLLLALNSAAYRPPSHSNTRSGQPLGVRPVGQSNFASTELSEFGDLRRVGALSSRRSPILQAAVTDGAVASSLDVDVAVVGGGPAAYAMAAQLHGKHGHKVALVDPNPEGAWPNNYGSWHTEWEALSKRLGMPELMTDCIAKEWPITDCFFGGSWGMECTQLTRLDRRYIQVDREGLKAALSAKFGDGVVILDTSLRAQTIAPNLFDKNLVHDADGSTLSLANGASVRARMVVDATGFESKLVLRESDAAAGLSKPLPPGYQIAYGFACDIKGESLGPYDKNAMTLFDYRTDHLEEALLRANSTNRLEAESDLKDAEARPSFIYVMPDGPTGDGYTRAFFEETSLVGRGSRRLEFSTLKKRAMIRLKHLGLEIREDSISDEEYCYIPMGGNLPDLSQRVIAIGGAAATVHPSTGYQLCRMLASSTDVAAAISSSLRSGASPDAIAAAAYRALWSPQQRFQRDFQVFGGEFLGAQTVDKLRGFFDAFFKLDMNVWGGFLAGWPGLPGNEYHDQWNKRLAFGLSLFVKFPPVVALSMIVYAVTFSVEYGGNLLRSFLTPLFGADGGVKALNREEHDERMASTYLKGDVDAKKEALSMLRAPDGKGEASPQVAAIGEEEEEEIREMVAQIASSENSKVSV